MSEAFKIFQCTFYKRQNPECLAVSFWVLNTFKNLSLLQQPNWAPLVSGGACEKELCAPKVKKDATQPLLDSLGSTLSETVPHSCGSSLLNLQACCAPEALTCEFLRTATEILLDVWRALHNSAAQVSWSFPVICLSFFWKCYSIFSFSWGEFKMGFDSRFLQLLLL